MKKLTILAFLAACGGKTPVKPQPVPIDAAPEIAAPDAEVVNTPPPKTAAELWLDECRTHVADAKAILAEVVAVSGPRTVDNTVERYNDLLIAGSHAANTSSVYAAVHPDEAIREVARTCEQEVSTFFSGLELDRRLYDALVAVDVSGMDADGKRFVEHTLRDFRHAGVDLDDATRAKLQTLSDEITVLGQEFERTIAEEVGSVTVTDPARLGGLPEGFADAHRTDAGYVFTTDYPDYFPIQIYATDDALRKELYTVNFTRGASNRQVLLDLLAKRREYAKLLGFADYADYAASDEMMKSGANAAKFLARVNKLAKKRGAADYKELLAQLRTHDKKAKRVEPWQKFFLENEVVKSKYEVDAEVVRTYFPFQQTLEGLFTITGKIYDLQYVPTDPAPWSASVPGYDVMRGSQKLGRIYLDMQPRDGKYKHAAQFSLVEGITGKQLPEGVLVCNFPGGSEPMEHGDVVTMFHEFGHLMHHVLGGDHHWITQTGTAVEHDFVEAPSQMFEEWAWSAETLAMFAKNAAGEAIPAKLVAKMRKADGFGRGTGAQQQLYYAALSLGLYTADPAKVDPDALETKLQAEYTPFAHVDGTMFYATFGHLVGYSSKYYTYMWSLVMAKDLLTPFAKPGLLDTKTTYKYRDTVLAPGGTKDAADLMHDFLGRDWSYAAFEKWLKS